MSEDDIIRKYEAVRSGKAADQNRTARLSDGSSYIFVRCSDCEFKNRCDMNDYSNGGCRMRKEIYDNFFSKIEFKTDDPIAMNRLRLIARYNTELHLLRNFGISLDMNEVALLKTTLAEFGKLFIDKKGELLDSKSKEFLPWDQDPEMLAMRKKHGEALAIEAENLLLREMLGKKKKQEAYDGSTAPNEQ